jgi:hypothetical protein
MKYKTFRALVIAGALAVGGLGVWRLSACAAERAEREERAEAEARRREAEDAAQRRQAFERELDAGAARHAALAAEQARLGVMLQPAADVPALAGTIDAASPEAYLRQLLGAPSGAEDKRKDVLGGSGAKINVYAEQGVWARAKVDHDRDEKIDEKWSLDQGVIVRHIAPADDEQYTRELRLLGAGWFEAGPAAPAPDAPAPADPATLATGREVDAAVMRALQAPVQEKIKDATGGTPYKVNLYSDDRARWNRLKIDLDRDEKWDEKWDVAADGAIERQVAPADDEQYTEVYVLRAGQWTRK